MSIKSLFEDIADAIREKSGSSDTYTPAEMPSAIRSIPSGSSTASGVSYDNTSSGLTASNVQDAIDELSGDVSTINSDLSEFDGEQIVTLKLRETINIQASQTIFTSLAGLLADNDFIMQDVMVTRHSGTLSSFPVGFTGTASPYASLSGYIGNSGYVLFMSSSGVIATGTEVNVCGTFKYIPKR